MYRAIKCRFRIGNQPGSSSGGKWPDAVISEEKLRTPKATAFMNRYRTRYWSILQYSSSTSLFLIYSISISIMLFSSISTLFLNFRLYFNINLPSEVSIKTGRVNGILFSMWNAVKPSVTWPWQAGRWRRGAGSATGRHRLPGRLSRSLNGW